MQRETSPVQRKGYQGEQRKYYVEQVLHHSPCKEGLSKQAANGGEEGKAWHREVAVPLIGCLLRDKDQWIAFRMAKIEHIYQHRRRDQKDRGECREPLYPRIARAFAWSPETL